MSQFGESEDLRFLQVKIPKLPVLFVFELVRKLPFHFYAVYSLQFYQ